MNYSGLLYNELRDICRSDAKYRGHSLWTRKADMIKFMVRCDELEAKAQQAIEASAASVPAPETTAAPGRRQEAEAEPASEPQTDYAPSIPMIKPALSKPVHVSSEEYLDDIAMPAPFWECQTTQSFTWGRWRFGEGESRQHGKYLSIACSELERHWIILWDWRSFEAAIKELIYGLSRLGEQAFIPSPGFLPAPPAEDEEPADGKDGDHGGGDPRRERNHEHNHLPNIDEVCVNCSGTQLCSGREHDCGCKTAEDCPTLGWCVSCLPDLSIDAEPWEFEHSSVGVPA